MIAAVYCRKSTEQSGVSDDQKSVARQLDHARQYAERKPWTVADNYVFVDDGISGAEFANRPGFLRLMNALKPRARTCTPWVQSTTFGDVSFFWYMNQGNTPAASTLGHLMDHVALSVSDLDAWVDKFRADGIALLGLPYTLGNLRAVMIEGPSREAIELVEVR